MKKILTVIIPTYNMEKLLEKNLQSLVIEDKELLKQVEILVVNDGSKDRSSEIAHKFEALYPDTFRVIDKENGNYGSCVNRGLKEATGKYIRIMDADDWYDTKNFELYIRKLEGINVDKIVTIFSEVRPEGKVEMPQPYEPWRILNMKEVNIVNHIPMHAIAYRTQLLRDMNYTQTEGISYTDQEWLLLPIPYVKTMYYIPLDVYQYYIGREGQTMDASVIVKSYPQLFQAIRRVLQEYELSLNIAQNKEYAIETVTRTVRWIYSIAFISAVFHGKTKCVKEMDLYIENVYPDIYMTLDQMKYGRVLKYPYIHEWRIKGRPLDMGKNHIRRYKLSHFYVMLYRIPLLAWHSLTKKVEKIIQK